MSRFVEAQQGSYEQALAEIRRGAKRTHWMWFVFPQIAGLGTSAMAQHFAIHSLAEARAYLQHPILGTRYQECVGALQDLHRTTAQRVFGSVDAIKLRSSLTLFNSAEERPIFRAAIQRWFDGQDERTIEILKQRL